jgi:hypothetical protein
MKHINNAIKGIDWNLLQEQITAMCFIQEDISQDLTDCTGDMEETARLDSQYEFVDGVINLLGSLLDAAELDGLCSLKDLGEEE